MRSSWLSTQTRSAALHILARIAVAEDEVAGLFGELDAPLAFVEQLGEVDVEASKR